ncbi:MAG: hypothetical protein V1738_07030 [Patescibacteria group bacterium]
MGEFGSERGFPESETEFVPASETEKDIPERLKNLHETKGEFLTRGVFFDVYDMELPDSDGKAEPFVFKDFRSGDVIMNEKEQISLFQHQYYEWNYLREKIGHEFFPESYWIRSPKFTDDEAHGFYSVPGKSANTMGEFLTVQLDRQLANRYNDDDQRRSVIKKVLGRVGGVLMPKHDDKPFIGAVVQKKVKGVPFSEALQMNVESNERKALLKESCRKLISNLRVYHDEDELTAFTWHGIDSKNVLAEIDDMGELTGRVYVIDANFIERPNKVFKEAVVEKLEENVFSKIEEQLGLNQ